MHLTPQLSWQTARLCTDRVLPQESGYSNEDGRQEGRAAYAEEVVARALAVEHARGGVVEQARRQVRRAKHGKVLHSTKRAVDQGSLPSCKRPASARQLRTSPKPRMQPCAPRKPAIQQAEPARSRGSWRNSARTAAPLVASHPFWKTRCNAAPRSPESKAGRSGQIESCDLPPPHQGKQG